MLPHTFRTTFARTPFTAGVMSRWAPWLLGLVLVLLLWPGLSSARRTPHEPGLPATESTTAWSQARALSSLPQQAQEVHRRILAGGPFRYDKDGVVFGNREKSLPRHPRGYYHEYTVPTPGSRDRGARRIVCGGQSLSQPETCFYTEDHYQSFHPIDPRH